jgi:pilus assembly protein FimV
MKRKPALLLALSLYSVPPSVPALGLGDIELRSSLNRPLEARIALSSWQSGELEDLKVHLADQEHFQRAGVEQVPGLSELTFHVVEASDGSAYIEVATKSDFKEPFLDFLIEVSWPQGRVLREYTLLLDPPLYGTVVAESLKRPSVAKAAEGGANPVAARSTKQTNSQTGTAAGAARSSASRESGGKAPEAIAPTSVSSHPAPAREANRALTYGPTAAGDTLWQVASGLVHDPSEDVNPLMLALFRTNPDAFLRENMNLLKKGVVLQVPDQAAVSAIQTSEALAEVRRHDALWEEYRQTVAARSDKLPSGELPGTETASNLEGQTARAVAGERVKLVSAGSAKSGVGNGAEEDGGEEGLRNELALATEEAEATKRENQDLRERLGDAETIIEDLRRLIEFKDDTISSLQHQLAAADSDLETPPAGSAVDEVEAALSDTTHEETTASADNDPASKAQAATDLVPYTLEQDQRAASDIAQDGDAEEAPSPVAQSSRSPVGQALELDGSSAADPVGQQVAAAHHSTAKGVFLVGALLFAGSGLAMWRRRHGRAARLTMPDASLVEGEAPALDASASVAPIGEDREPTETDAVEESNVGSMELEAGDGEAKPSSEADVPDEDPLAEVNVYLAYERFEQAEQLVKQAIEDYPSRHEYKLKLLEIFAAAKETAAFKAHARALRDAVGDKNALMEKASAWWRDLCPDQDLFGEDTAEQDEIAVGDKGEEAGNSLGWDDFQEEAAASVNPGEETAPHGKATSEMELDFDLGSALTSGEKTTERTEGTVDFDLGFEGMADGDGLQQEKGPNAALGASVPDGRGPGNTKEIGAELDFNLDGETAESNSTAEGTIDFDLASLELADSSLSSVGDVAEESGSDETVDLDYSFGDSSDEQTEDGLESLELNKAPEEGTVDFDVGLPVERTATKADPDDDGLGALAMEDAPHDEDLSSAGADLELELDDVTPAAGKDAKVEASGTIEKASGTETTESLSQDKALDEWVELEGGSANGADRTLVLGKELSQDLDEIQTKLELAQAYMDMGDAEGARSILDEVMSEGDNDQKQAAKELISKMA